MAKNINISYKILAKIHLDGPLRIGDASLFDEEMPDRIMEDYVLWLQRKRLIVCRDGEYSATDDGKEIVCFLHDHGLKADTVIDYP